MTEQVVVPIPAVVIVPTPRKGERMGKLMFSLSQEYLRTIGFEAKARGITVQELLRAVIIPDWFRDRTQERLEAEVLNGRKASRKTSFEHRPWTD